MVTTKANAAFSGVLFSHDNKALVLRGAAAIGAGHNGVDLPLDGEILILMADVAYIQRP